MSAEEQNGAAAYNEVFEESMDERQSQTIQHIRANSSIMQLKKILGKTLTTADRSIEMMN
jgi:hypothetical protein